MVEGRAASWWGLFLRDQSLVEVPGGVAEHRKDDDQTDKGRRDRQERQRADERSPDQHDQGTGQHRLHAGDHRRHKIDLLVQEQRHGDHADRVEDGRQHRADDGADDEEPGPVRGGENGGHERLQGADAAVTQGKGHHQPDLIGPDPEHEQHDEGHPAELAPLLGEDHQENVAGTERLTAAAPARHFVKSGGEERGDEREPDAGRDGDQDLIEDQEGCKNETAEQNADHAEEQAQDGKRHQIPDPRAQGRSDVIEAGASDNQAREVRWLDVVLTGAHLGPSSPARPRLFATVPEVSGATSALFSSAYAPHRPQASRTSVFPSVPADSGAHEPAARGSAVLIGFALTGFGWCPRSDSNGHSLAGNRF